MISIRINCQPFRRIWKKKKSQSKGHPDNDEDSSCQWKRYVYFILFDSCINWCNVEAPASRCRTFFFFFLLHQGIEAWNLVSASLPNGKLSFVAVEMTVLHVSSLHLIWSNYIINPNVNMWANNIYQFHSLFVCCLLPFIFFITVTHFKMRI